MTDAQQKALHAALRKAGIVGPERHTWATRILGREIGSFKDLTRADAGALIDAATEAAS